MAGVIGRYFGIDPMVVLDSSYTTWALRVAAYRYAAATEVAADEERVRSLASRRASGSRRRG